MKRLIVCCDGTWNNPEQEDNGIPSPTNVFKIYNAVADKDTTQNIEQLKYYHPGVGGEGGLLNSITGGAVGAGINGIICSAYHWLGKNYQEGDEIYLFGFSRGAFTARSLAGFIGRGLLNLHGLEPKDSWKRVHKAYDHGYQAKDEKGNRIQNVKQSDWVEPGWLFFNQPNGAVDQPTPIHFIGVWDTVGSLGVPDDLEVLNLFDNSSKWGFHDAKLGKHIKTARHAMAIDEIRSSFSITRWDKSANPNADLVELWFPGVHCDVGGGYADCALANGALLWMMEESENAGVKFRDEIKNTIKADPLGSMHNSYKGVFAKMRSRPRNIEAMTPANQHLFHDSALKRQRTSPITSLPYHPTRILEVGEQCSVEVFANTHWNYTGVYLPQGQQFTFSAQGQWQDGQDSCDWTGTEHEGEANTTGDRIRSGIDAFLGRLEPALKKITDNQSLDLWGTKRVESIKWFVMVGAIANDSGSLDAVKNDGSSAPHQYVDLTKHTSSPLSVESSGYLYCFPNDAWGFYDNNRGSVKLTITRVS